MFNIDFRLRLKQNAADRSLDLSSGVELERFGTPLKNPESLDGLGSAVYGGGVNFYNGVSHFGLTTIGEQTPAPNPYSGPLITNINNSTGAYDTFPGEELKVYGERLSSINKVFVNNLQGEVVSTSDEHFVMITPEGLTAGSYDLVVESSIGNLRFFSAFVVTEESANRAIAMTSCEGAETSWWTKRISDSQAKAYIKCPEVGQKYRILQQTGGSGEYDSVFVKTITDENDSTQVFNEFGRYIVRTLDLEDINRIRIMVDDEELWKVRYNR